jgi:hypothetical protein
MPITTQSPEQPVVEPSIATEGDAGSPAFQRFHEEHDRLRALVNDARRPDDELLNELVHARGVDNLFVYVADVVEELLPLLGRPRARAASQRAGGLRMWLAVDNGPLALADRRLKEFSYYGVRDLNAQLGSVLALPLSSHDEDVRRLGGMVEDRCLAAHYRGIVNSVYLARRSDCRQAVGARLSCDSGATLGALTFLHGVAVDFDRRARTRAVAAPRSGRTRMAVTQ